MIVSKYEARESFDEMLDDCYETVQIGGSTFYASTILKECDPIAYDIGLDEYIVGMVEDGEWMVEGYEEYAPDEEEID